MAGDVNIRRHPVTGPALAKAVPVTLRPTHRGAAMSPEWKRNWEYFRDQFAPEMTRTNRDDQQACLGATASGPRAFTRVSERG
jgi:hypothetical protein